ncbi:helix-turn-helix transcriptional regulator [Arthrobacter alpinus]|uniref:helix-turn-helix domain-containing protein n=1 Tax=Arthrobacter alpinus TaxID=656366 RepID=UPI000B25EA0C|nr:helix-turn-helix transcriptional regulator [Arthrobacter alpinus]MDD0857150.1 helix-turn-helix transcriptional regulator [Arthrobacter alpinus]
MTARELEISLMAAQGLSDKSIAAALHVSVRTVEGHLYRAYAKLEITDRNDLVQVLSD